MTAFAFFVLPFSFFIALVGCGKPNKANIELRKQNADLRSQVDALKRQHEGDAASLAAMEKKGSTTAPSLASEQLSQLFTVHGIELGKLTGVDPDQPGKGLKVYVVPTDGAGEKIKAAGSFVVDAFDLSKGGDNRIAHAEFPLEQAEKNWFGKVMLYTYVLPVAVETMPAKGEITIKVTFKDGLTGREFSAQKVVKL